MNQLGIGPGLVVNVLFDLSLYLSTYLLVNKGFSKFMEKVAKKLDERFYKGTSKFMFGQEFIKKYPMVKKFIGYTMLAVLSYKHIKYGAFSWLKYE